MFLAVTILFTVALTLGVKIASMDGMILQSFRHWAERKNELNLDSNNPSIYDAIIICHWCMPSIWSLFGYFFSYLFFKNFDIYQLVFYPITVCASSVLNGLVWGLHNKLNN